MSGNWAGSTRAARLPTDWPATRARILQRDGHRCTVVEHGIRCSLPAADVDHIRHGDDHSDANLAAICTPHHRRKSSAEGNAARQTSRRPAEPHPGMLKP